MNKNFPDFIAFPKVPRLFRECVVTEKIDGTNGVIHITENGDIFSGSRSRWLNPPNSDNFGFGQWVMSNQKELLELGPGTHFGEWYGHGIQRGYGLKEKRFSLFNAGRWTETQPPTCCSVVPVLHAGVFDSAIIKGVLSGLGRTGSVAAPGFMNPEGIIIYHTRAKQIFKFTFNDEEKGL